MLAARPSAAWMMLTRGVELARGVVATLVLEAVHVDAPGTHVPADGQHLIIVEREAVAE